MAVPRKTPLDWVQKHTVSSDPEIILAYGGRWCRSVHEGASAGR